MKIGDHFGETELPRWFPVFYIRSEGGTEMALDFAKTAAFFIIFGFLWRYIAARQAGTPVGSAMAFIH
jgi:hypothetical protein